VYIKQCIKGSTLEKGFSRSRDSIFLGCFKDQSWLFRARVNKEINIIALGLFFLPGNVSKNNTVPEIIFINYPQDITSECIFDLNKVGDLYEYKYQ
jgi:hypothetical protein